MFTSLEDWAPLVGCGTLCGVISASVGSRLAERLVTNELNGMTNELGDFIIITELSCSISYPSIGRNIMTDVPVDINCTAYVSIIILMVFIFFEQPL